MAITINTATGTADVLTEDAGGTSAHGQVMAVAHGAAGSISRVSAANPLPVGTELPDAAVLTDADVATLAVPSVGSRGMLYSRVTNTWVRAEALSDGLLLASAARAATASSPLQTNHGFRGVLAYLNVTAITGAASVSLAFLAYNSVGGNSVYLFPGSATPAAVTAPGIYAYLLGPGVETLNSAPPDATNVTWAYPTLLPRMWSAQVAYSGDGTDTVTYSLGFSYAR